MNRNLRNFTCLAIKKEVEDHIEVNFQKILDNNNDPPSSVDIHASKKVQSDAVSSTSPSKSSTPKKRARRRYIYSRPKKKKKKDICENLVDTVNILNVEQLCKNKDFHSDCSSDTIILDDLSEELSKDSANIGNEISNNLTEAAKLQPPELGRLLISDGMLIADANEQKQKKGAGGRSRAKSTKFKGKQSGKMPSGLTNKLEVVSGLSIKKELEETFEPQTKPPVLPVGKGPMSMFSEKDSTFSRDFKDTTNLFSLPVDTTVEANKKRRPQTARRGKKRQLSCDRTIIQQPENITFNNHPNEYGNNLHIGQSLVSLGETISTPNCIRSSVTEMPKAKKTAAKKRSPAKRNIPTSVDSDIDRNVSNFLVPPFSNVMEQIDPSCHPINLSLTENKQKTKRTRSSPNKRNTTQRNSKSLDSSEADTNVNLYDFTPVKKTKGRSPRKATPKKSLSSIQKGLDTVGKQCAIKSSLVISLKKELSEPILSDNSVSKFGETLITEEFVNTNKVLPHHNAVPSTKKGGLKTYVSLSFEEDTSKKDEPDEHLSFLLSLRSKKSKSRNVKNTDCLKNLSKNTGDSSEPNFKQASISSSSPVKSDPKLQPENTGGNLSDKSASNLENIFQSNPSCTIDLNIPNIKKEGEHFPNNSVEMHSVNKMGVLPVNNNIVECSKEVTSNSNVLAGSTFQSESSNIHTSNRSSINFEKSSASVKKETKGIQENENTILRSILINVEKLQNKDSEKTAMKSLNELAKTCLNHLSETPILNTDIAKLPSNDNNSKTTVVDIPTLGPKPSENLISKSNNDVLNTFAFNSDCVQGKTCELPSVTLPLIQIKQEPEEALSDRNSKAKDSSTLESQALHNQGKERTSSSATLKEACSTHERDISHSILNFNNRPNTEPCQLQKQPMNETSFAEPRVTPSTCIENTASKSQDSLVINSSRIQIKKERVEVIKSTINVEKEPSRVSLADLSESNVTILTENYPTSNSSRSLLNDICNIDDAVTSSLQTTQNTGSNYGSTPVVSIKREICSVIEDNAITLHKNADSNVANYLSSLASKEQSVLNTELETNSSTQITDPSSASLSAAKEQSLLYLDPVMTSATQIAKPSSVSSAMNSNQSCDVSDLSMDDVEKSFTAPSSSAITKKMVENSSVCKSNPSGLRSKNSIDLEDDVILISDDSSSGSSSISSSSDSDNESIHSLGDFEGPPRKKTRVNSSTGEVISETDMEGPPREKTRVNLSTGEVISEADSSLFTNQNICNSSYESPKNLSDVDVSKSTEPSDFSEFMERVGKHVTRVRALEKEKSSDLTVVEPEVDGGHNIPSTEITNLVPEHVSNETTVADIASISRSVDPNCQVNSSAPVPDIINSLDSMMTSFSSSLAFNSNNLGEFDFLINYKKNALKFRKHPYPGDIPFRKRKREADYFRYDKEVLNLTIEDMKMKLKEAEKVELHAPEDPSDAIRLDIFCLVPEEAECYYEVLSTDPSVTLISKCQFSIEDSSCVDDIICLSGSPNVEDSASSVSEALSEISTIQNINKHGIGSLENNKSVSPTPTEQNKETGSFVRNDVVFLSEIGNLPEQNLTNNAQQLKSLSNDTNAVEVIKINIKDKTNSNENAPKTIPVSIPPLGSALELANLSPAVESSIHTNTFPNNSIQSNKITLFPEMSESLSKSSDNMLSNEKSISSSSVLEHLSGYHPQVKVISDMTTNSKHASSCIDKYDNVISQTSNIESSVSIVDSHSGNSNDKSIKEITCSSNNSVLLQHSSLNSIPEQSFPDFKQPSSSINIPILQLSELSSNYPKLLTIPETTENAASETIVDSQIDKNSPGMLILQTNESCCSEKDENSQAIASISNVITNSIFSKLDLPTAELRKILENVNVLPSSECNEPPSNLFNSKEAYQREDNHASYPHISSQHVVDYGHGVLGNDRLSNSQYDKEYSYYDRELLIKIPIVRDYGHKSVKDLDNGNLDSFNKETMSAAEVTYEDFSDAPACSKSDLAPDSDEDDFDNDSELPLESSHDQMSIESEQNLDEKKEPADQDTPKEKPQYKSRFQRVMERVSSKKSASAQPSEHLLPDCFPLKSSKDKSSIRKPIALVQPCSQKFSKNPPKGKKLVPLNDKPLTLKDFVKNKESKKSKKDKSVIKSKKKSKYPLKNKLSDGTSSLLQPVESKKNSKSPLKNKSLDDASSLVQPLKSKKKSKSPLKNKSLDDASSLVQPLKSKKKSKFPLKNKSLDDASSLFQPDKIVNKVEKEKSTGKSNLVKSSESSGNRLYGRVTNRGSFLTQSSINQPPKPKVSVGKKNINTIKVTKVPTDELHLMVHSPDIDIIPTPKQPPSYSNDFFKSGSSIGRSTSFLETIRRITSPKTSFNDKNSFLRPQFKDPRTVLKNLSPDLSCPSPNESSNFFITPEPFISSNLSPILPNVQSRKMCLPPKLPLLPNPDVRPESPQSGRRTLLPTPQIGFNKKTSDNEAWLASVHTEDYSDSFRDFDSGASLLILNSPSSTGSPINFNAEPSVLNEQSSPVISSNVHIPNRSTHHRHSRLRQTRCVCLPPKSLKASVGNAVFDTTSVLLLILEWNVDWLVQQQKNHDPPPISTFIRKVVNTYEDNDEYYNTYLPLMLLETWQRIYMSWTHLHQATSPYFCEITSYAVETHSIKVQCQAVFKSSEAERGLFPEEGNIIMVKFGTKEKGGIKILGYVRDVKVKPFDTTNDSLNASFKCLKYTSGESLQMLLLTFSGAYSSDDFDTNQLIRIQILCNIKSTLKQNDALLNLKSSPLYKNILNPLTDGLRMVTVVTRNVDPVKMNNNVSECVRDIIKGITSPHPLPLLTIAKSMPSSDRLLVLPPLIEMMKNSYKNKVLLCTRTTKALTDIGFNLCGGVIKFVILGKKSDIHQKLRKYLLEEVANKKLNKELSEGTPISENIRNDLLVSTKLEILKNCDVVLSLIRNSHNDLVAQAYADGECVAQMCCIIDEANLCTEPEILIPLLYGISKLILIGDPDVPAKVCSKTAASYDYNRSLFHRAYELDIASE